jgi:hypothetical protein
VGARPSKVTPAGTIGRSGARVREGMTKYPKLNQALAAISKGETKVE